MKNSFLCLGIMSGTSLDGLDIAMCDFKLFDGRWKFQIKNALTYSYEDSWKDKLSGADKLSGIELILLHNKLGLYIGERINDFLKSTPEKIDFIASHGHTVFHQPERKLTCQIGSGAEIAAATGITTICDFRSVDVSLSGQGAPLVPIGDKLLFPDYSFCLNLGGFANISFDDENNKRIAFDICPVNIILNSLARIKGLPYDDKGNLAQKGNINDNLLQSLNNLEFYQLKGPKSLGKEWLQNKFIPIINNYDCSIEDKLRTICEHIALQVSMAINDQKKAKMLITGGGTYNNFLIDRIQKNTIHTIEIPDNKTIEFKEALIFAFLGVLRIKEQINCLKDVTGAIKDNIGGAIYKAF